MKMRPGQEWSQMPYSEDTGLPEGFAADDYEVQHIVLEDQNDIAGLTQTFQQTPTGLLGSAALACREI